MMLQLLDLHPFVLRVGQPLHLQELDKPIFDGVDNPESQWADPIDGMDNYYIERVHDVLVSSHLYEREDSEDDQLVLLVCHRNLLEYGLLEGLHAAK
jgi:hypothetical protein